MTASRITDITVGIIALLVLGTAFYAVHRYDEEVLRTMRPFTAPHEPGTFRPTPDEQRIAARFADSTLPELRRLGLIRRYTRTEAETVITVSGPVWKARSGFFKESLIEQLFVYNRVNGFALRARVLDDETGMLYAEIAPPNRRIIY